MIRTDPGLWSWYPSSMCSPWYCWFVDLGYDRLDIKKWEDGEFALIEYYRTPIIPSLTQWNYVLTGIRNVELTPGFVEKYVRQLDLHRKEVWAQQERDAVAADERHKTMERHAEDTAEAAFQTIRNTPTLVERIAKNGFQEMNLEKIHSNIPSHQLIGHKAP